ncbi:Translocon-associated protein subunit delta [Caligus rogercresseyi]|uniref:Translocon-associated protein subunit delta n=1 Tax=Caligus rogercresseyi TaxID=217165 RepID=A0A7T8H2P6_CALRO|nr:Translocon-associated protein subunit delta [Caligus rogercresseyi]
MIYARVPTANEAQVSSGPSSLWGEWCQPIPSLLDRREQESQVWRLPHPAL